jgi:hypothetical protein
VDPNLLVNFKKEPVNFNINLRMFLSHLNISLLLHGAYYKEGSMEHIEAEVDMARVPRISLLDRT